MGNADILLFLFGIGLLKCGGKCLWRVHIGKMVTTLIHVTVCVESYQGSLLYLDSDVYYVMEYIVGQPR